MPQYKVNDSVRYKPVGGPQSHTSETVGVIKEVLTSPGNLTGRQVQASAEDPRYEGRSRIATLTNAPQSRNQISLNIVNFSRPLTLPFVETSGGMWADWMAPARGDDLPGMIAESEVNVEEGMAMEVRLCVDGCGILD